MIPKGDSNTAESMHINHKMVKIVCLCSDTFGLMPSTHTHGLCNASSDYCTLLCLFGKWLLFVGSLAVRFIAVYIRYGYFLFIPSQPSHIIIIAAVSFSHSLHYPKSIINGTHSYFYCVSLVLYYVWTRINFEFDCIFKAIIRIWKILTNHKAFCLNQLIIRGSRLTLSFSQLYSRT